MRILGIVLVVGLFLPVLSFGQNELIVEPYSINSKFLNDVIRGDTTAGGQRLNLDRVYVLRRGGLYFVQSSIQNTGYPLRVKSENAAGQKPEIHAFRSIAGTYPAQIFQVDTLLDIKNLILVGWDEGGESFTVCSSRLINVNKLGSSVYVDSCVLHATTATHIQTSVAARYVRVTNTTFANCGNVRDNNLGNGRGIDFRNVSIDSAFVQNCSFLNMQDRVIRHYGAGQVPLKNLTVNHNTFVNELAEHGCIGIGKVDGKITIINNLFHDNFLFGNDTTAYVGGSSSRLSEFGDTGEKAANGQWRMTFVGTSPDSGLQSTSYLVRNNFYSIGDSIKAFYDSRNALPDAGIGNLVPLTWYINGKIGADSTKAFYKTAVPVAFTAQPKTPMALVRWFFAAVADSGAGKLKQRTGWRNEYDFDRRVAAYFADTLNLAYQISSAAYTGGDQGQPAGDLRWWHLTPVSVEGPGEPVIPDEFTLNQNYPNPFNPATTIRFDLPQSGNVVLSVFNLLGQEVATLVNARMNAGKHVVSFDASRLTSGVYFYTLSSGNFVATKKMILMK